MLKHYSSADAFLASDAGREVPNADVSVAVSDILKNVRRDGDAAVLGFTQQFDGVKLERLRVPELELQSALAACPAERRTMFETAIENVRAFHVRQAPENWREKMGPEATVGVQFKPLESVGVYVPGGSAAYPSTVIMTVVPAQIAGVERIVLVSPPGENGRISELVLTVAALLGVEEVYAMGGAQAIAALAYGTQSVASVCKIVGPGNQYVNDAKRQVFGTVGIDSLAGPTELAVLCDDTANPEFVARDLFAQAEHDPETRVVCVTTSMTFAEKLAGVVTSLLENAPRQDVLKQALANHGAIVVVQDIDEAVKVIDHIAPEHLEIVTREPRQAGAQVRNAGAIFLGPWTPAVLGDYCVGPNHVLPTGRSARFSSPLGVFDFVKFSSVLQMDRQQFLEVGNMVADFAGLEGLFNHKQAIECRKDELP